MKFYKTILTLLAMTLAVIGTTATVVHGDGPETVPDPAEILSGELLDAYNGLTQENRDIFTSELLPVGLQDIHPDDEEQAVGVFVTLMKRAQDRQYAAQQTGAFAVDKSTVVAMDGEPYTQTSASCGIDPDLWHSSFTNRVYASTMASCAATMLSITASVRIRDPGGSNYSRSRVVQNTSAAIVSIHRTYEPGRWGGFYSGSAEGLPGGPSAGPIPYTTLFEDF